MARRATGTVVEHTGKDGRTFWALRFTAYGKRRYLSLGAVSHQDAERQLGHVLADVDRGTWQPAVAVAPPAEPDPVQTFHEYAEQWWLEHEGDWLKSTQADYRWRLEAHLLPFFGTSALTAITIAEVDRYKAHKLAEVDGLSGESINKTLMILSAILDTAEERELIPKNPARGKRRRVKARKPRRTYLDTAGQIVALLDAAGDLDVAAREDSRPEPGLVERRALLAAYVFGGLRTGEALDLRWRDVDLAAGRLRIGKAKTDAGRRDVRLAPLLRDELLDLKVRAPDTSPDRYVFGTAKGRRQGASNIRRRVLAKAVEHANARLEEAGEPPLSEGLEIRSLRRTFASVLYATGASPAEVMAQMGHTTPGLALRVYAQAMRLDDGERDRLKNLVEGSQLAVIGRQAAESGSEHRAGDTSRGPEIPQMQGFPVMGAGGFEPPTSRV